MFIALCFPHYVGLATYTYVYISVPWGAGVVCYVRVLYIKASTRNVLVGCFATGRVDENVAVVMQSCYRGDAVPTSLLRYLGDRVEESSALPCSSAVIMQSFCQEGVLPCHPPLDLPQAGHATSGKASFFRKSTLNSLSKQ